MSRAEPTAFLMPAASVLGHMPAGARVDQIIEGKTNWKVSAMALTYRIHDLGLLTDWQYRSACAELSTRGYRTGEPAGMRKRETSQVLVKVFRALKSKGMRASDVAQQLGITTSEMSNLLFGQMITALEGGAESTGSPKGSRARGGLYAVPS